MPEAGPTIASTSDERTVNNVMRHQYRVLSEVEKRQMQALKDKGLKLHELIASIGKSRSPRPASTWTLVAGTTRSSRWRAR